MPLMDEASEKSGSFLMLLAGVLLIATVLAVAVWLGITTAGSQASCGFTSGTAAVEGPSCG